MTLKDILSKVSAIDDISIQNSDGVIFNGLCQDFRATYKDAYLYLDCEVEQIRAFTGCIIILL